MDKTEPPITADRLTQIAAEACDSALAKATHYQHAESEGWNQAIINKILATLVSESTPADGAPLAYKFACNSTIIQHLSDPTPNMSEPNTKSGQGLPAGHGGRRGMHSAMGAYWNNQKDGMWSYKYEGGDAKGMDVIVSIVWIAI